MSILLLSLFTTEENLILDTRKWRIY